VYRRWSFGTGMRLAPIVLNPLGWLP